MRLTGTEVNAMLYSNRRKGNRPEINPLCNAERVKWESRMTKKKRKVVGGKTNCKTIRLFNNGRINTYTQAIANCKD